MRFEGGYSRLNRRREMIIRHHGKIARQITIMAENADVPLDDGFYAALMSCSAVAGDFATTKAIYLSYLVRKECQFLRNIGDDDHLKRIRGVQKVRQFNLEGGNMLPSMESIRDGSYGASSTNSLLSDSSASGESALLPDSTTSSTSEITSGEITSGEINGFTEVLPSTNSEHEEESNQLSPQQEQNSIEEEIQAEKQVERYHAEQTLREYGPDTRLLTSLLHSYSNAMQNPGLGTVWNAIIHEQPSDINAGYLDERTLDKLVKYPETISESNLPKDIPMEEMAFASKSWNDPEEDVVEGRKLKLKKFHLKQMNHGSTQEDYVKLHYEQKHLEETRLIKDGASEQDQFEELSDGEKQLLTGNKGNDAIIGSYYDASRDEAEIKPIDQLKYKSRDKYDTDEEFFKDQLNTFQKSESSSTTTKASSDDEFHEVDDEEFENDDMDGALDEYDETQKEVDDKFGKIAAKLGINENETLTDEQMMKLLDGIQEDFDFDDDEFDSIKSDMLFSENEEENEAFDKALNDVDQENDGGDDGFDENDSTTLGDAIFGDENEDTSFSKDGFVESKSGAGEDVTPDLTPLSEQLSTNEDVNANLPATTSNNNIISSSDISDEEGYKLQRLSNILPGLPRERLSEIMDLYEGHLSDPSVILLVPILREKLPIQIDIRNLRDKAYENALVTMKAAEEGGLVDGHVLNGMLQVVSNSQTHNDILEFYDGMDSKYGVVSL